MTLLTMPPPPMVPLPWLMRHPLSVTLSVTSLVASLVTPLVPSRLPPQTSETPLDRTTKAASTLQLLFLLESASSSSRCRILAAPRLRYLGPTSTRLLHLHLPQLLPSSATLLLTSVLDRRVRILSPEGSFCSNFVFLINITAIDVSSVASAVPPVASVAPVVDPVASVAPAPVVDPAASAVAPAPIVDPAASVAPAPIADPAASVVAPVPVAPVPSADPIAAVPPVASPAVPDPAATAPVPVTAPSPVVAPPVAAPPVAEIPAPQNNINLGGLDGSNSVGAADPAAPAATPDASPVAAPAQLDLSGLDLNNVVDLGNLG